MILLGPIGENHGTCHTKSLAVPQKVANTNSAFPFGSHKSGWRGSLLKGPLLAPRGKAASSPARKRRSCRSSAAGWIENLGEGVSPQRCRNPMAGFPWVFSAWNKVKATTTGKSPPERLRRLPNPTPQKKQRSPMDVDAGEAKNGRPVVAACNETKAGRRS